MYSFFQCSPVARVSYAGSTARGAGAQGARGARDARAQAAALTSEEAVEAEIGPQAHDTAALAIQRRILQPASGLEEHGTHPRKAKLRSGGFACRGGGSIARWGVGVGLGFPWSVSGLLASPGRGI